MHVSSKYCDVAIIDPHIKSSLPAPGSEISFTLKNSYAAAISLSSGAYSPSFGYGLSSLWAGWVPTIHCTTLPYLTFDISHDSGLHCACWSKTDVSMTVKLYQMNLKSLLNKISLSSSVCLHVSLEGFSRDKKIQRHY